MSATTNLQILAILGTGVGVSVLFTVLIVAVTDRMNKETN